MNSQSRRQEYAEVTRQALLQAARSLFAEQGYAHTSIDDIVQHERLTKGALYHHFKNKQALFETVVDDLMNEMVQFISTTIQTTTDPWERTFAALDAFLTASQDPTYQRLVIQEAPVVLGWDVWRKKEQQSGIALTTMLLNELMDLKLIQPQPVELVAQIMMGALMEASLAISHAQDPDQTRIQAKQILQRFVQSLRFQ